MASTYFPKYKEYRTIELNVQETGHDYDFAACILNDSPNTLAVYVDDLEGWYSEPVVIPPNDWMGLLADEEGFGILSCIKDGDFRAVYQ